MVKNHVRLIEPNLTKFHYIFGKNNQFNKESRREVVNYTKGVLAKANKLTEHKKGPTQFNKGDSITKNHEILFNLEKYLEEGHFYKYKKNLSKLYP